MQGDVTLYYKLTNSICTSLFNDQFARTVKDWYEKPAMRRYCQQGCLSSALRISASSCLEYCVNYFFDDEGVLYINKQSLAALADFPMVRILDDYSLTHRKCNCSRLGDGRHYHALAPLWWQRFRTVSLNASSKNAKFV